MDIKTKSGFKCVVISEDVADNWELLEMFRAIDKGDTGAIVDAAPLLLGNEQYAKLKEHVKKKHDGTVKSSAMVKEISEILTGCNPTKNS